MDSDTGWEAAWVAALDELEIAVDEAQRLLVDAHHVTSPQPWRPPVGLGPLPASLETRARALLARQLATAENLAAAAARSRRQLRALSAMRPYVAHPPVYVDVDG
ncbi:MAG TPA: hypothetical protein VGC04_07240 [Cellulomonas sp.]